MTREQLKEMGLSAENIDVIMKENGKDIERERAKFADYEDVKSQLEKANTAIDSMKDYEDVKAKVAEYKQQAEKAQQEAAAKISQLELKARIKDFTNTKKFVNDLTRDAINAQLESALNDDANKGKSIEDLFKGLTDGKENIFINENAPTPPTVPNMSGKGSTESGVMAAFKSLNPNISFD